MPQYQAFLKALGLYNEYNQLSAPPGSMVEASNVIIRRDNVVEPRRGFKLFGNSFGTSSDVASQILEYKNRILRHYNNTLQYDTGVENAAGESIFASFFGNYSETSPGLRIKSIEANNNLYFTTSDGIKKISATSAGQFSSSAGYITNAGGIKALDISTHLNVEYGDTTGFLPVDSTVAYRVVWGKKDVNDNVILGTPSSPSIIYNSLQVMVIRDMMQVLYALDQLDIAGSRITDADYVNTLKLPENASASQILQNLQDLCQKLDEEQGTLFATADIIDCTFSAGVATIKLDNAIAVFGRVAVGDKIFLKEFNITPTEVINGVQTVVGVTNDGTNSFIQFETTITGTVVVSSATIESGQFRGITVPEEPSTPATHDELVSLQTYLSDIITELQGSHNLLNVAKNNGINTQNPLEITTAAVTGTTTLTINFDTSVTDTDANNEFIVGDLIDLTGVWTAAGAENISGVQTVASVDGAGAFITVTLGTAVTNGAVTIDATSEVEQIMWYTDSIQTTYINDLTITTTATVIVDIIVPTDATLDTFYQIYRGSITTAAGTDVLQDLIPNDEMKLVYEDYPTQAQLDARLITVEDIVPESFVQGATNLYTNEISGEGILQSNDIPPLAKDINVFKNYTWYANTSTRQRLNIFLLGVTKILEDYNNSLNPKIVITSEDNTNEYSFVKGVQEVTSITTVAGASLAAAGPASYFLISNGNDEEQFYVWYNIGTATDPAVSGRTGIEVMALATDTNVEIAEHTRDRLNTYISDFSATSLSNVITVTNITQGPCTDASAGTSGFTISVSTQGAGENFAYESTQITCIAGNLYTTVGTADYFTINTPFDRNLYAFWFNVSSGTMTAPVLAGRTVIPVDIDNTDTNAQVAAKVQAELEATDNFDVSILSNVLTVTNIAAGPTLNATEVVANAGFLLSILTNGALDVLLSTNVSPSIAVQETSESLVRVINKNTIENVNAFYLSGISDTPGNIFLESKSLEDTEFYVLANQDGTGSSFNPNLSPEVIGITNTAANPTVVSAANHGMSDGDEVIIVNSNSVPSISGLHTISGVVANTSFTLPIEVITAGTTGSIHRASSAVVSNNEVKINRLYYSKLQQPEAVPLLNYLDVGSENKAILRIFPLRDSLFVFKEDGLYRISGETPPWNTSLFDQTVKLIASDSLGLANNLIYCWTKEGIVTISEAGKQLISRPIDVLILPISSSGLYTNFSTATWGVGYESDNAYYVYTVTEINDEVATICFRYSNLTNTWTTYDKTNTCGIVKYEDDKLYLGAGDVNYIEIERKSFNRTDYADRQFVKQLLVGNYFNSGATMKFNNIDHVSIGDVITQDQTVSVYAYNMLLKKLDLDPQLSMHNYFSTLEAAGGNNMRAKLVALAAKLDTEPGLSGNYSNLIVDQISFPIVSNTNTSPTVITSIGHDLQTGRLITIVGNTLSSPSINGSYQVTRLSANTFSIPVNVITPGTGGAFTTDIQNFTDLEACFNLIILELNADPGAAFANYDEINEITSYEAIITDFNPATGIATMNVSLPFVQGPLTLYKHFDSSFIYSSLTLGDPVGYKQIREAEVLFENKTFTSAVLSFSTDLLPEFIDVPFNGLGNGLMGNQQFGINFFGGNSHQTPFRTYVPRQCQRCRSLDMKFTHGIAREKYSIFGTSVTARVGMSSRAYR